MKKGIKFTVLKEHLKTDEIRIKCTAIFSRTIKNRSDALVILGDIHRSSSFHISDHSGTGKIKVIYFVFHTNSQKSSQKLLETQFTTFHNIGDMQMPSVMPFRTTISNQQSSPNKNTQLNVRNFEKQ